jgi:CRP-like cAMP-binding protein
MAEAVENALLSEIDRVHFEELMISHPTLGVAMTRLMIVRRRELENKDEPLVFRAVSSKLAEQLVKLAGEYGVDDARGTLVALKITHQELANLIGSTRETVSLTLSQFKRKRLIATEGRKVIISDTEALRALY